MAFQGAGPLAGRGVPEDTDPSCDAVASHFWSGLAAIPQTVVVCWPGAIVSDDLTFGCPLTMPP